MTSATKDKPVSVAAVRNRKLNSQNYSLAAEIVMILITILFLYPFLIMIFVSLKSPREALVSPSSFPTELHFENFVSSWNIMNFEVVFVNTVIITVLSLIGIVVLSGLAGYVIAWSSHKKFYNVFYILFLCGLMVPYYTSLVPLVKLMANFKLTNSLIGLSLYYWGRNMPMAVFLYVGFIKGVSGEILESGKIDGANLWQLYWRILFPVMKPITTTIIILDALHLWNDFLFPRLMLSKNALRTISLSQYYFSSEHGTRYELAFAAYLISAVPILILYFLMQKNIIKGVAAGAVKG